jgi:hypothetical protein
MRGVHSWTPAQGLNLSQPWRFRCAGYESAKIPTLRAATSHVNFGFWRQAFLCGKLPSNARTNVFLFAMQTTTRSTAKFQDHYLVQKGRPIARRCGDGPTPNPLEPASAELRREPRWQTIRQNGSEGYVLYYLGYKGKCGAVIQVLPRQTFFLHRYKIKGQDSSHQRIGQHFFPRKPRKEVILGPIIPPSCSGNSLLRCYRVGISALYGVRPT